MQEHPDDAAALEQLASIYADAGDVERLGPLVNALERFPGRAASRYYIAANHFLRSELDPAHAPRSKPFRSIPDSHARRTSWCDLRNQGDAASARKAFQASLLLDPQDPATYQNLALLELNSGNAPAAAQLFTEALTLDPSSEPAREGLARARAAI